MNNTTIHSFLAANPGISLQLADLFNADALAQYNWPSGADPKQLLQQLRIRQRLLKICTDDNIAALLEQQGIHSAHHLASVPADNFVQLMLPALQQMPDINDARTFCLALHHRASVIRRQSLELAVAYPDGAAGLQNGSSRIEAGSENGAPDFEQGIPDYLRLFGPMLTCDCDECMSIFGPAAYFVDLMRVVSTYVTPPIEQLFTLQFRRPDLWKLPLDCLSATTEVSYLDIVDYVLQQHILANYTTDTDASLLFASAVYPFSTPYNKPLENISRSVKTLGTSLTEVYEELLVSPPAAAAAALQLSPEQLKLVNRTQAETSAVLFGFPPETSDSAVCTAMQNQETFLEKTGLLPEELERFVYQGMQRGTGDYALNVSGNGGALTANFTDNKLAGSITLEAWIYVYQFYSGDLCIMGKNAAAEFSLNITSQGKLAGYFGNNSANSCTSTGTHWSIYSKTTLPLNTWVHVAWTRMVGETGTSTLYINGMPDAVQDFPSDTPVTTNCPFGIGYCNSTSLYGMISEVRIWNTLRTESEIRINMYRRLVDMTDPALFGYWPLTENSGTVAHDKKAARNATLHSGTVFQFYEALPANGLNELNPALLHNLFLNNVLDSGQYLALTPATTSQQAGVMISNGSNTYALNSAMLQQVAALLRLRRQTGWSYEELDWVLRAAGGGSGLINDALVEAAGSVAVLQKRLQIPVTELAACFANMKTFGWGTSAKPADLWDTVFNSPPITGGESGITSNYYRPQCSDNPMFASAQVSWDFASSPGENDLRLNTRLAAALQINEKELLVLASAVTGGGTQLTLSVQNMSLLYRISRLARALQMPVADFIALTALLDMQLLAAAAQPWWNTTQVETITKTAAWMKTTGLTVGQLYYLKNGAPDFNFPLPDLAAQFAAQLDSLVNAGTATRLTPAAFQSDMLDVAASEQVFKMLTTSHYLDQHGIVLNQQPLTPQSIYELLSSQSEAAQQIFNKAPNRSVLQFNGSGTQIAFTFDPFADPVIQSTNTFTISFWVRPDSIDVGNWPVLMGYSDGGTNETKSPSVYQYQDVPNAIQVCEGFNGTFYSQQLQDMFLRANEWVYFTWVNDNGYWKVYRNGQLFFTITNQKPGVYQESISPIGYYAARNFGGAMANIAIWNIARTAEQIASDMFVDLGQKPAGLIDYWPVNEGEGTTINNSVNNNPGYNGTATVNTSSVWVNDPTLSAMEISAQIWSVLVKARATQEQLVYKTMGAAVSVTPAAMTGICYLSGKESPYQNQVGSDPVTTQYPFPPNLLLTPAPTKDEYTVGLHYLDMLAYNTYLLKWAGLSGTDMQALYDQKTAFGTNPGFTTFTYSITQQQTITGYAALKKKSKSPDGLLTYFVMAEAGSTAPSPQQADLLGALMNWSPAEILAIASQSYFQPGYNFNTVDGLLKMASVFRIERLLAMHIDSLNMLRGLPAYNLFDSSQTAEAWASYNNTASALAGSVRLRSGEKTAQQINLAVNAGFRDVMCDWLIWKLGSEARGITNPNELYEYLLIDVSTSPDVKTSWLVAGMNSIQLYVNRCLNSLEPGIINNIPEAWWSWMSTYRVWQANREVYLYPENYADPSLRRLQTDPYKELISEISKGQITESNVKQALAGYLESVSEVASLELIDGYVDFVSVADLGGNTVKKIYLVGRSRTQPYAFYTRCIVTVTSDAAITNGSTPADATEVTFGPWEPVSIQANSAYLSVIPAFGRLFLFWLEQTAVVNTLGSTSSSSKYTTTFGTVYYAFRDSDKKWSAPVMLRKELILGVSGAYGTAINYYPDYLTGSGMYNAAKSTANPYVLTNYWQKVAVQLIPSSANSPEGILASLGTMGMCSSSVGTVPPAPPVVTGMALEAAAFQQQLYASALLAFDEQQNYASVIGGTLLDASLQAVYCQFTNAMGTAKLLAGHFLDDSNSAKLEFNLTNLPENLVFPDPYGFWPGLNDTAFVGSGAVYDVSGKNNGTISGTAAWLSNKIASAPDQQVFNFSGGSWVFPWTSNAKQKNYTIAFRLFMTTVQTDSTYRALYVSPGSISGYTFKNINVAYALGIKSGKLNLNYKTYDGGGGGNSHLLPSKTTLVANTWYSVVIVVSPSSVQIYLNGVNDSGTVGSYNQNTTSTTNLTFGTFAGGMYDFRYWNMTLNSKEIYSYSSVPVGAVLLQNIQTLHSLHHLSNSAAAYVVNLAKAGYLVLPDTVNRSVFSCLSVISSGHAHRLRITYAQSPMTHNLIPKMKFIRINTDVMHALIDSIAVGGVPALLSPLNQYHTETGLTAFSPNTTYVIQPDTSLMNFNGAFGIYFWELFFYAPLFIAEKLADSQQFMLAEQWYQYIFDPTSQHSPVAAWPISRTNAQGKFPDLCAGAPATFSGITESATPAEVPFAWQKRNVWTFAPSSSSQVTVPWSAALNPPRFTVMAWIKMTGQSSGNSFSTVVCSQDNATGYHLFMDYISATTTRLTLVISTTKTTWLKVYSDTMNIPNRWMFVAGTYDGEKLNVFIDGVKVTANNLSPDNGYLVNKSETLRIGYSNSDVNTNNVFNGQLADVTLFDYALSAGQIEALFADYKNTDINAGYWNFRPFRRVNAESLYHILNGTAWENGFQQPAQFYTASEQLFVYEYDPFDPDTLARLRVVPWQKAAFMKYIRNLVSWGDASFTQNTWESISNATMRYVLADTLLGRFPAPGTAGEPSVTMSYADIVAAYGTNPVPPFLIESENQLIGLGGSATPLQQAESVADAYFCVPPNKQMLQFWEIIADRLFKIRHGLTIDGATRETPLFAPAVSPSELTGNNALTEGAQSLPAVTVPWFRFAYMINTARTVTAEVIRLGNELNAALEKRDAEKLAQLQSIYQVTLNTMVLQIKTSQANQLLYAGVALQSSLASAQLTYDTYTGWLKTPVSTDEAYGLDLLNRSAIEQEIAMGVKTVAVFSYLLPTIFGLADGGFNPGESINATAGVAETAGQLLNTQSQQTFQTAQFTRRSEEWTLQQNLAANQVAEISAQITANNYALEAAQQDIALTQMQINQSQELLRFMMEKFTNEALYEWMAGQLNTLYYQMYRLAWALAQGTQSAMQYELNISQRYLNSAAWNPAFQGLLAGDALSLALQQMENAYIAVNKRKLAIRKTWSMRQQNPQALLTLLSTGQCDFSWSELMYDQDYPGHFNRKIKTIAVTVPAVVGPYQNIHATLQQTGNTVVMSPSPDAVKYLTGVTITMPADGSLRVNWNPNQEIVLSSGLNDSGVFQLNLNDEQYLPFEGTGAVSSWHLEIPQATNTFPLQAISDVIFTIDYSAEDGGNAYASQIVQLDPLKNYQGYQYLSLRQLYGPSWFSFCNNPVDGTYNLPFALSRAMYPANLVLDSVTAGSSNGLTGMIPVVAPGAVVGDTSFVLNDSLDPWIPETQTMPIGNTDVSQPVPPAGLNWTLHASGIDNSLLNNGVIDGNKLIDLVIVLPFSGTVNW